MCDFQLARQDARNYMLLVVVYADLKCDCASSCVIVACQQNRSETKRFQFGNRLRTGGFWLIGYYTDTFYEAVNNYKHCGVSGTPRLCKCVS